MAEGSSGTQKLWAKAAGLMAAQTAFIALDKGNMDTMAATSNSLVNEATEAGMARTAATVTNVTTTVANDTVQWQAVFTMGAIVALSGAGVLSASSGGDLWAWHRWAGVVTTNVGDTLTQTFKCKQTAGV